MDSGALIYIPRFVKIGSAIQNLTGWICIQTRTEQGDLINLILFFRNKESHNISNQWASRNLYKYVTENKLYTVKISNYCVS
jgi:hypothetical protein